MRKSCEIGVVGCSLVSISGSVELFILERGNLCCQFGGFSAELG